MTKGIIVIDMPESCSECPSFCGFYSDMNCRAMNNRTINYPYPDSFRQSWCPIESLPEKIDKIVEQIKEVKETVWVADEVLRPEQVCDIIHEIIEIVKGGAV